MRLTLVIPGLLWPRQALHDTVFDLCLPALETLLGFGVFTRTPQPTLDEWWRDSFALPASKLPAAALRQLALGVDPGERAWLCVDPVNLSLDRQGASLNDPALLKLDDVEARALHASLAPLFAEFGELRYDAPQHWHLALTVASPAVISDLRDALGRPGDALLPQGDAGRPWRRALNEAQMLLHTHAVNREREAIGKPLINSLVLWGAGSRPATARPAFDRLLSDDLIISGLARCANLPTAPLPTNGENLVDDTIVHLDALLAPTRMHDALAWREALSELDQRWIAPSIAAIRAGRLAQLDMIFFGETDSRTLSLRRRDLWKFWRRPASLDHLAP
jgi:hypothetical protein